MKIGNADDRESLEDFSETGAINVHTPVCSRTHATASLLCHLPNWPHRRSLLGIDVTWRQEGTGPQVDAPLAALLGRRRAARCRERGLHEATTRQDAGSRLMIASPLAVSIYTRGVLPLSRGKATGKWVPTKSLPASSSS